jgi:regulator of replication initiation timing
MTIDLPFHPPTQIVQRVTRAMHCSECGVEAAAACDCGAPYVPAGVAAANAVAAHPEKSDRAIAAEIGVSDKTVGKARRATAESSAVDTRVGLDGKARKQPAKKPIGATPPKILTEQPAPKNTVKKAVQPTAVKVSSAVSKKLAAYKHQIADLKAKNKALEARNNKLEVENDRLKAEITTLKMVAKEQSEIAVRATAGIAKGAIPKEAAASVSKFIHQQWGHVAGLKCLCPNCSGNDESRATPVEHALDPISECLTADPKKGDIPLFLQTQNRKLPFTPEQQALIAADVAFARRKSETAS